MKTRSVFDPADVAWINLQGNNSIRGIAALRRQNGDAVTCAGLAVRAIPHSPYAAERMLNYYGSTYNGHINLMTVRARKLDEPSTEYLKLTRETQCDELGRFEFNNLPDGVYFITTHITWSGYVEGPQARELMKRVMVQAGEEKRINIGEH